MDQMACQGTIASLQIKLGSSPPDHWRALTFIEDLIHRKYNSLSLVHHIPHLDTLSKSLCIMNIYSVTATTLLLEHASEQQHSTQANLLFKSHAEPIQNIILVGLLSKPSIEAFLVVALVTCFLVSPCVEGPPRSCVHYNSVAIMHIICALLHFISLFLHPYCV